MTEEIQVDDLAPDFSDPKERMKYVRSFIRGPIPQREEAPENLSEKDLYDKTLYQVWDIICDPATDADLRSKYHMAILRWQGKLDAVDEKHLEELKKLMERKAS